MLRIQKLSAALTALLVTSATTIYSAAAQQSGPAVPPYADPSPVQGATGRTLDEAFDNTGTSLKSVQKEDLSEETVGRFRSAYAKAKRPRVAIYWNRQLSDTLSEWYGNERLVIKGQGSATISGDKNLNISGNSEQSLEHQRRASAGERGQPSETWMWEFEDGFIKPFMDSNVILVDRATIVRIAGAKAATGGPSGNEQAIEMHALQGLADIFIEVLVSPSTSSRVGYELRATIKDVQNGRVLGSVNSRNMHGWGSRKEKFVATDRGYVRLEDDDNTGPVDEQTRYQAGPSGYVKKQKPPRLNIISRNLALNVMDSMAMTWNRS